MCSSDLAKLKLAVDIVSQLHTQKEALKQRDNFIKVFSCGEVPEDIEEYKVPHGKFSNGKIWIIELITLVGFASSGSDARRLIKQGAVSIDGEKVTAESLELELDKEFILRVGRHRFKKITVL